MTKLPAGFAAKFPGFTLQATRAFWGFLAVVPLLGLAALNTGNNALYLLFALALGSFVASGTLSRYMLRHVSAHLRVPREVYAKGATVIEIDVENDSFWLPAASVVCRFVGMPGAGIATRIAPRGRTVVAFPTVFPRRGLHPLPRVQLEVRLPLPFFVKILRIAQDGDALVYPCRLAGPAPRWSGFASLKTAAAPGRGRRGGEVQHLREFHAGDDRRDVHWKQTARQQRLIVAERRESVMPSRYLVLDRQLPRRDDPELLDRFEDLVCEVAAAAVDRLKRGEPVGLILGGSVLAAAAGPHQARRVLTRLAVVNAVGPGEDPLPSAVGEGRIYRLVEGL